MSLKERLGFEPFRRRIPAITRDTLLAVSDIHNQYGEFYSRVNARFSDEWRSRGLDDFPLLCSLEGVSHVGVNLEQRMLHVLTTSIDAFDDHDVLREIGEIIVTFDALKQRVTYENVTHPRCLKGDASIAGHEVIYAHPHICDGTLCCTGNAGILQLFKDAQASEAMSRIIRNLRMRKDEVELSSEYLALEHWPRKRLPRR